MYQYNRVTIQHIFEKLANRKELLVFWDIHTCERILAENWKFSKERVVQVDATLADIYSHVDMELKKKSVC